MARAQREEGESGFAGYSYSREKLFLDELGRSLARDHKQE